MTDAKRQNLSIAISSNESTCSYLLEQEGNLIFLDPATISPLTSYRLKLVHGEGIHAGNPVYVARKVIKNMEKIA